MFKKTIAASLIAIALLAGVTACGSSDVSKSKFKSELVDKSGLTEAQATCVTDKIYEEFDQGEINDLYSADTEADLPDGLAEDFTAQITSCVT